MSIPIVKSYMDDAQIYDIIEKVLDILPSRKEVAIWSDDNKTANRLASIASYTDKSHRISRIQVTGCKALVVYNEPTMLPFDAVVEDNVHEYYKTFGW